MSQKHDFPVSAGGIYCVYLMKKGASLETKEPVAANVSKLSAEDRKLAEKQKFCAVQNGVPLGAMGVPVKIDVKGQSVFLCCEACRSRAEADAEKTLAKVKELAKASKPEHAH
jgi:hypothetical protein